ncbi:hypothetical protein T06_11467 [Trichinella sp. T6]|nr:hypothetical protein T06_11467 [Trichinella sp. T6]
MRRSLVARYIELGSATQAGGSFGPPMSSSLAAGGMNIYGADLPPRRHPIMWSWFGSFDLSLIL